MRLQAQTVTYAPHTTLAKPSAVQYAWQEQGRIMFVTLGPATWEGREYDNHSIPLSRINPKQLSTDQWCRVARSWGAKEILFVAKHTGGFCWWQTHTSNYGIRNTPWKGGKGDVLKELSASCKKYGLNLGIYLSPADATWGAGIGSGGRTKDPEKQAAYNKIYRQQLREVLTRYGKITEVWFDGSLIINVKDILAKYAKNAVILQGPEATIRWVGNEDGIAPYPAWNSVDSSSLKTGVATAAQGYPDGNAWAPLECDAPLYNHYWFWSKKNEQKRKSFNDLMEIYYKSVGRGATMLLNATPDTTGLIPKGDVKLYAALGKEIKRRFAHPLAVIKNSKGDLVEIDFKTPSVINQVVIMEDYKEGERIRAYEIEGYSYGEWRELSNGSAVGRKRIV
ncbi:MAG: alpha-L-fucosidase, partial [Chitinophagaceae bacterium]